ncbi:ATP-binding cassette subfamily B protein [Bacillus ectoiniformans]|uniref:ABC transporter ATP-binding protein n=1 Tax=Bacillus ectoiniformans TaxID=1494429 RepID=UPI00195A73A4|nr:ABC transporter ATP-binding protein [Bacillus ectoiniformans]MBM7650209.1 ATP-binding cassette subfamily B protein [Bacillus ectoiniformans]
MKQVLSYLHPYKYYMAIAWLLMLVELVVELAHPLFMAKIIDEGIVQRDLGAIYIWGGIMLGSSILAFAAGVTNSFFAAHVGQNYGFDIRAKLIEKVQSLSFASSSWFAPSSLITRMTNDVTQLQNAIFMSLRIMLRAPLLVIFGIVMAFVVHMKLAAVLLVTTPLMLFFLKWMMRKSSSLFRVIQKRLDRVNNVMQENLSGIRLIKAFLRSKHESDRFKQANEQLMEGTIRVLRMLETTTPVLLLVMNTSLIAILWFGLAEFQAGTATPGEIVAVINYATRIISALTIFTFIITFFARGKASAERIAEVMSYVEEKPDDRHEGLQLSSPKGKIELKHVSFSYPESKQPVLADVSLTVQAGETAAILGATGSGKSTLFYLIPRLFEPDTGTVLIDGHDLREVQPMSLRRNMGFVPQEAHLFTGTIKENIAWGKEEATEAEMVEAAMKAQIHETIMQLPDQYDTLIGQKGVNLSGGQKQRISIARALIRKPSILLLDDSTSALDAKTEAHLLSALKEEGSTIFMITQKISTAMQADRIFILADGRIEASGSHTELMESSQLYLKMIRSQFGEEGIRYAETGR